MVGESCIVQRADQRVRLVSGRPGLYQAGGVFDRRIHIRIRRDGDIPLGITMQGNDICQVVPGVILESMYLKRLYSDIPRYSHDR